ncbi:MAG: zf-HC2 domain-containing protein [Planctomycetes bacterium]|nr:zf-HC2 domain-containing protein [Planctomycetota bacterium]
MVADKGCPDTQELIAYLNGALPEFEAAGIRAHVEQPCERCASDLKFLHAIRGAQDIEFDAAPPWVDAKAAAIPRLGKGEPEMVFDSEMAVFAAASRSAGLLDRKLIWRVEDFFVEIDLDREGDQCAIAGRICGGSGEQDISRLKVVFSGAQGNTSVPVDAEGEFHASTPATRQELRLYRGTHRIFSSTLKP